MLKEADAVELASAYIATEILEGRLYPHHFHSVQRFRCGELHADAERPDRVAWIVRFEIEDDGESVIVPGLTMVEVCGESGTLQVM